MKRKLWSLLLTLCMALVLVPTTMFAEASDTYEIADAEDLLAFEAIVEGGNTGRNAVLTADIDMSSVTGWNGIGGNYTGTFDGKGHTISNLSGTMGLFVNNNGTIKNINMQNVTISGGGNNGVLAGHNKGQVFNCVSSGSIRGNGWSVGGIVGYNDGGTISGCISSCDIPSNEWTQAGLVGSNWGNGKMTACYYYGNATKKIEADGSYGISTNIFYKDKDSYKQYANGSSTDADRTVVQSTINQYVTENGGYFYLNIDSQNNIIITVQLHKSHPVCGFTHNDIGDHTGACSNLDWEAWNNTDSMPTTAGNYYLTTDVMLSKTYTVSADINLCLNGYKITAPGADSYQAINVSSGFTLNLCDCNSSESSHTIINPVNGQETVISGGLITGFKEQYAQAFACVAVDGTLNMYGGTIAGNCHEGDGAGYSGVLVKNGGQFKLYGGAISHNKSGNDGAAVYVDKSGAAACFTMYGGEISGNDGYRSVVSVLSGSTFVMAGGRIINNTSHLSPAVTMAENESTAITLYGTPIIRENTGGNLFIPSGSTVIIGKNGLTDGAEIGVQAAVTPTETAPVPITENNKEDYSQYFKSDNSKYDIKNTENHVIHLTVPHVHNYTLTNTDTKYLKIPKDCEHAVTYYKSCSCGASSKGTADEETFTSGVPGHDYGAWTSNKNGTHTRICSVNPSHTETKACSGGKATCKDRAKCKMCGAAYGEPDAANHTNLVKTDAKAATHLTEGNIAYWYCDGCKQYFSDAAGTAPITLEDTIVEKTAKHTADETGWHSDKRNHWNVCACGDKINMENHDFQWVIDKKATKMENGTKHEECTVCGYKKAKVEIPATGTNNPITGDSSSLWLCFILMLMSGIGLAGTSIYLRKKKY